MSKINMNVMIYVMNGCYTNGGADHYSRLPYFMQTMTPQQMVNFMRIVPLIC